jgi:hypothetical protein
LERHYCAVVEAGQPVRKELVKPEVVQARLGAKGREGRDPRFPYAQAIDADVRGERLDRLQVGRLDHAVIAEGVLQAGVVAEFITVGRVVLGDAVDVAQHIPIFQHGPTSTCHVR